MPKVLIVGDSRKMKGGVNTVIRIMEDSFLWDKYKMYWVECQINSSTFMKVAYLIRGLFVGIIRLPFYQIVHFQTTPAGLRRLCLLFFFAILLRKRIIIHLHVGNQLEHFQKDKYFKYCCKRASRIITLGRKWMDYVPVREKEKVVFLYNPAIPIQQPTPGEKYFLFAAYLDIIYKGYDTLIEGFAKVIKKHPDWRLVVCGTGEIDNLKSYVRKYGIEDYVDTPGWVEGTEKERYFKNCYAYVMTSLMEGLPMSILESMSYGKPIITTPVGCLPEFLTDNESALIFDFKDAKGLSECMNRLIENNDLYNALVQNEQRIIEYKFTRDKFLSKLDSIYQSIK